LTVLQAGTLYVDLQVKINNVGNPATSDYTVSNLSSSVARNFVKLWYFITPFTPTANALILNYSGQIANYMECKVPFGAQQWAITQLSSMGGGIPGSPPGSITRCLFNSGGNLFTWFESPPLSPILNTPPQITITSIEF
jgi:hypothetical protein